MVALFVALTITALVLIDIFVIQRAEMRREVRRAAVPAKPIVMVPEVGLTMADGGEELKKEEKEKASKPR